MSVLLIKLLGYAIIFGVPAAIAVYALNPTFRDQVNKIIMGTNPPKLTWRAHITNG